MVWLLHRDFVACKPYAISLAMVSRLWSLWIVPRGTILRVRMCVYVDVSVCPHLYMVCRTQDLGLKLSGDNLLVSC